MKIFHNFLMSVLLASILAGCSSTGHKIADADIASLQKGKTTYAEALMKIGKPTSTSTDSNGKKKLMYTYAHSQVDAKTFIPFAGAFVGGSKTDSQTLSLVFDKNDLLEEYSVIQDSFDTQNH